MKSYRALIRPFKPLGTAGRGLMILILIIAFILLLIFGKSAIHHNPNWKLFIIAFALIFLSFYLWEVLWLLLLTGIVICVLNYFEIRIFEDWLFDGNFIFYFIGLVLSIIAGYCLFIEVIQVVICSSCGWRGSYDRYSSYSGCPLCGSDIYSL